MFYIPECSIPLYLHRFDQGQRCARVICLSNSTCEACVTISERILTLVTTLPSIIASCAETPYLRCTAYRAQGMGNFKYSYHTGTAILTHRERLPDY